VGGGSRSSKVARGELKLLVSIISIKWLVLNKSSTIGCLAIIKAFCMYIYGEKEMALDTVLHNTGIAIAN